METYQALRQGIGFLGLLTLLFIGLKLAGKIDWSWWWVLAPALIPATPILAFLLVLVVAEFMLGSLRRQRGRR